MTAAEKKAQAAALAAAGTTVKVKKYRHALTFIQDMPDMAPELFKFLGQRVKETGAWLRIQFSNGKVTVIDAGQLAAMHNEGVAKIFVEAKVSEDSDATLLPTLKIGFLKGELRFE